jgi:hypothetical protein
MDDEYVSSEAPDHEHYHEMLQIDGDRFPKMRLQPKSGAIEAVFGAFTAGLLCPRGV